MTAKQATVNAIAEMMLEARDKFAESRRLIAAANDRATALEDGNYIATLLDGSKAVVQCDGEGHVDVIELRNIGGAP